MEPPEPPNRYQRQRLGELIHIDVKKLGRILRPRHRVTGNRRDRFTDARGYGVAGRGFVQVCIDDATRLAYVEVLADEKATTATPPSGKPPYPAGSTSTSAADHTAPSRQAPLDRLTALQTGENNLVGSYS